MHLMTPLFALFLLRSGFWTKESAEQPMFKLPSDVSETSIYSVFIKQLKFNIFVAQLPKYLSMYSAMRRILLVIEFWQQYEIRQYHSHKYFICWMKMMR